MSHQFAEVAVLSMVAGLLLFGSISPSYAAGETYTLTPSPVLTQEGSSTGVSLLLAVNNAMIGTTYSFTWTVTDPSGNSRSIVKSALSTASTWNLTARYPTDFGASLSLVGAYSVNVSQVAPSLKASVAAGQFRAALTDSLTYQRTFPVSVKATGYLPMDNVTISISRGLTPVPGFPTWRPTDSTGGFSFIWQSPASTPTGNYTVTLTGKNTAPKTPPDSQQFTIYPTNVTIPILGIGLTSLQRSETLDLTFNANYLSGVQVISGSGTVRLTEPDGVTSHSVLASFDSSVGTFRASYPIPLSSQVGIWVATLDPNSLNDGYGNGGPAQALVRGFSVQPASLKVAISTSNQAYTVGDVLQIYAAVTSPAGASYLTGNVTASLTASNSKIAYLKLSYDPTRQEWFGGYQIRPDDPSGTWLIQVQASDSYGNSGTNSASYTVSVPATTTSTWIVLLPIVVVVGLGLAVILLRLRQVDRREVKLDVQTIKHQADQVKGDDFFKSIQAQLARARQRMKEKEPSEGKE